MEMVNEAKTENKKLKKQRTKNVRFFAQQFILGKFVLFDPRFVFEKNECIN